MADSKIEWTDAVWNCVVGCDKVSAGCTNCYAIDTAYRQEFAFRRPEYQGTTMRRGDGSRNWTGLVRTLPGRLEQPLGWRQPRRIFVNSMSDVFHEDVPDQFIDQMFAVMAWAHWHTYQVLTKRPERMLRYLTTPDRRALIENARCDLCVRRGGLCGYPGEDCGLPADTVLPMSNVWLGVSVEDQAAADERIPLLLQTPAAVRFLSCEPLIGPVDLRSWLPYYTACGASDDPQTRAALDDLFRAALKRLGGPALHWVIAGGESGAHARPMQLEWVRSLRDQCQAAGVAFHFKQWGGRTHAAGGRELDGRTWDDFPRGLAG